LACSNISWHVGIFPETSTVYGGSDDKEDDNEINDDGRDLPTIENPLFSKLQEQSWALQRLTPTPTQAIKSEELSQLQMREPVSFNITDQH
jgi:hypothetical protein